MYIVKHTSTLIKEPGVQKITMQCVLKKTCNFMILFTVFTIITLKASYIHYMAPGHPQMVSVTFANCMWKVGYLCDFIRLPVVFLKMSQKPHIKTPVNFINQ